MPANQAASQPDLRLARLTEWAHSTLRRRDLTVTVASADASFRRYFRLSEPAGRTWVVMDESAYRISGAQSGPIQLN